MHKIPVAILGATGNVGQKFVELLLDHPWFEIAALCASERSSGKQYGEVVHWNQNSVLPDEIAQMMVQSCEPLTGIRLVFSALDSSVAGPIEETFAEAGHVIISNAKNHRMDPSVPLVIAEVNPEDLALVRTQSYGNGMIVTNPNCSTIGLVLALKPIVDRFGVKEVSVVTLQALSGAGYPGVPSLDMLDNIIPFISGEEEKIETEPIKILGKPMKISAQCNRVPIVDGHTVCVSLKL